MLTKLLSLDFIWLPSRTGLVALVAVALLFTPNQAQAQTLSISQDRTVRDTNGNGVIYQRALEAMELDPTGVWSGVPVAERMNVGVFVKLDLVATPGGATVTNIQWTIPGQVFKDTILASNKSTGAGYRTQCDLVPLTLADLQQPSIQYVYVDTGVSVVTLSATVNGTPLVATKTFDVRRHPKAEIFYVTGPGAPQTTDPGDNRDNQLGEHRWWHFGVQGVAPSGEFLRFHRGFIQKFNCWRAVFGYPAVKSYVTAPGYVPAGPEVDHTGLPGTGTGVVDLPRDTSFHGSIDTLPDRFTLAGDGSTALADFSDENALSSSILPYHDTQHSRICHTGDFRFSVRTAADPIFWRFHWMLTQVHEAWQFLDLENGGLTVPADSAFGAQVFFPEPAMKIFPTAAEASAQDCFPPSGSFIPIGTTFVSCAVNDVTLLDPASPDFGGTTTQVMFPITVTPPPPPTVGPVDIFFVLDLSGSFIGDLPTFKSEVAGPGGVIDTLKAANPDTQFGLGIFEDYPISPFGLPADRAYERILDLTLDATLVKNTINALPTPVSGTGGDGPQSQLAALFQAATGVGQDLSAQGFPAASIPSGQQANFRTGAAKIIFVWTDAAFHNPGDPGDIPYPGPSFQNTVDEIAALDPPVIIGIAKDPAAIPDLEAIAVATDSLAPVGGVDCDDDGTVDILEGGPLVCSTTAPDSVGIGQLVDSGVRAALQSPIAEAGPFQVIECDSPAGASVTLNGDASRDPITGDPLSFLWTGPFGTSAEPRPTVTLPLGHNSISLSVTDPDGNTGTDRVLIIARDTTPPVITSVSADPDVLWPPNHKMTPIVVQPAVSDACDGAPTCQIISVSSDEPVSGPGHGNTAPDWQITGGLTLELRAERSGSGEGRSYTITIECEDAFGNKSQGSGTVTVPHDRR